MGSIGFTSIDEMKWSSAVTKRNSSFALTIFMKTKTPEKVMKSLKMSHNYDYIFKMLSAQYNFIFNFLGKLQNLDLIDWKTLRYIL